MAPTVLDGQLLTAKRNVLTPAGRLGDFEKGNSISFTAERTSYRGMRRIHERFLLRRERLLRVLNIMNFLPNHYCSQLDRYGKLSPESDIKIAWRSGKDGAPEFLFKPSFPSSPIHSCLAQCIPVPAQRIPGPTQHMDVFGSFQYYYTPPVAMGFFHFINLRPKSHCFPLARFLISRRNCVIILEHANVRT